MPSIESIIQNIITYLEAVSKLQDPSVNEIANTLKWTYNKTKTFTKALESLGLIEAEWTPGPPQRFIIRLTEKGKCIISCFQQ